MPLPTTNKRAFRPRLVVWPGWLANDPGMTLLETTVVILVLLTLIAVLFVGARAWKRGSDRAVCIMNLQLIQKGVRGYSNLHDLPPGSNAPGLQSQVIGLGCFVESTPYCPAGGTYTYGQAYGVDTIPPVGTLYMECSLSVSERHTPSVTPDW